MIFFRILFISFTLIQRCVRCQVYEECQGVSEPDVVMASKKSCAKYVFCDGENSYEAECLIGYHFNGQTGSCDDPINVKCDIEPNNDVQSIYDVNFLPNESAKQTTRSDENVETITNAIDNGTKEIGFHENKKNSSQEESNTPAQSPTCPPLKGFENIRNMANAESCVAFYSCYNGHAIPMLCPSKMYFNENAGKCESQMPESCKLKYSVRLNCLKGVYHFVPHPTRCEYYYYCVNGYLMIMRCPNDFTWHYERGTCVHKSQSKCFSFYRKNNHKYEI